MNRHRRLLLRAGLALAALLPLPGLARRFESAFQATDLAEALEAMGAQAREAGDAIDLDLPVQPENSSQVSVTVTSHLPDTRAISLLVADNPWPLAWHVEFPPDTLPFLATRIKLRRTTRVLALVHTDRGLYRSQRQVRVIDGGCG